MKNEEIANTIRPYLEESPLTIYQLAASLEVSTNNLYQKLRVLEAAGYVRKIRGARNRVLWQMINKNDDKKSE